MLLMAYRAEPESFTLRRRRIDPEIDWRFIFKRYGAGPLPADEALPDVADKGQPDWFRDLKTVMRRRLRAAGGGSRPAPAGPPAERLRKADRLLSGFTARCRSSLACTADSGSC